MEEVRRGLVKYYDPVREAKEKPEIFPRSS
jgi:hypothetical protein